MKSDLTLSSVLDEYARIEKRVISLTRKHPVVMLGAAAGFGFALGVFGVMRVVQAGVAIGFNDKFNVKDFLDEKLSSSDMSPRAHA